MIELSQLPKVLYKPREVFEDLRGNTNAKEGIVVFVFSTLIGLIIYGSFARSVGVSQIPLNLGVGTVLAPKSILIEFSKTLAGLFFLSFFSNKIAIKLGGSGNVQQTFGMLSYTRFLVVVQSFFAIVLVMLAYFISMQHVAVTGFVTVESPLAYLVVGKISLIFGVLFLIWTMWLQATAISVEHNIKTLKALGVLLIAIVLTGIVTYPLRLVIL